MLEVRDLWVGPPGAECPSALRGVSLSVAGGEWVAVTGPNGSGKSTLALALAGLLPPRSGTVLLEGRSLSDRAGRARVALILQEMSSQLLQPSLREELGFTARNLGEPEPEIARRTDLWSVRLGLKEDLERDPRSLSAGRQQLALVAAGLVAGPALLVADEAGAHLDPEARRLLLETLRLEVDRGLAVVWVTQEPAEREAADRTLVLGDDSGPSAVPRMVHPTGWSTGAEAIVPSMPKSEAPRLDLVVSPWDGLPGPAVKTYEPLTIRIPEQGVTAVEGRNGSGKSVILECAAGVRRLEQVKSAWRNEPKQPPILAAQSPELQLFEERVADEVVYAAASRGVPVKRAREAAAGHFEALGLGGERFLERRSWDLSAGERRLTQIVAALITPASLILLDEPTCGLDEVRRFALAELIGGRSMEDPVLVATQDSEWAANLGARRFTLRS